LRSPGQSSTMSKELKMGELGCTYLCSSELKGGCMLVLDDWFQTPARSQLSYQRAPSSQVHKTTSDHIRSTRPRHHPTLLLEYVLGSSNPGSAGYTVAPPLLASVLRCTSTHTLASPSGGQQLALDLQHSPPFASQRENSLYPTTTAPL
jgi:hypothetical protein